MKCIYKPKQLLKLQNICWKYYLIVSFLSKMPNIVGHLKTTQHIPKPVTWAFNTSYIFWTILYIPFIIFPFLRKVSQFCILSYTLNEMERHSCQLAFSSSCVVCLPKAGWKSLSESILNILVHFNTYFSVRLHTEM